MQFEDQLKLRDAYKFNINDFKIISKIYTGGFGTVFSVQNKKTRKKFAAKVINYSGKEEDYKQMINREISIMIRIQHPTIIKFFGYSLVDFNGEKNVTILMQLSTNGSLADYLVNAKRGHGVDDDNTIRQIILIGIARGMMFLHQKHILHRDLKPLNILLDSEYHPLIIDFGLSKFYEPNKSPNDSPNCGTPIYIAPEIITEGEYSEKTDVYAFGILMYEVVTNQTPFQELRDTKMTSFKFKNSVAHDNLRPLFNAPVKKSIRELIESCWSAQADKRPSFEEIFKKLAYANNEWIIDIYDGKETEDEYDINKYFLENVDIDKIECYVDTIIDKKQVEVTDQNPINELKDQLEKLAKENEEMKKQIAELKNESKPLQISKVVQTSDIPPQDQNTNNKSCSSANISVIQPQDQNTIKNPNNAAGNSKAAKISNSPPQTQNINKKSHNTTKDSDTSEEKKINIKIDRDGEKFLKIVFAGLSSVGKTSIIYRLLYIDMFSLDYMPTVGVALNQYTLDYNSNKINLNIWDTAGMERFRSISTITYREADVAIIVYDQTNLESSKSIQSFIDDIKSVAPNSYIIIVGNKDDLPDKVVSNEEIYYWCLHEGFGFVLTSAKTGLGISDILKTIEREISFENPIQCFQEANSLDLNDDSNKKLNKKCC